mmetsp:Transcript_77579/g.214933  ORF Transcript_77579/g.214933 Transcript_77579/m.214933 type:complete len:384 (+) Transcript_77579:46-1197(+)
MGDDNPRTHARPMAPTSSVAPIAASALAALAVAQALGAPGAKGAASQRRRPPAAAVRRRERRALAAPSLPSRPKAERRPPSGRRQPAQRPPPEAAAPAVAPPAAAGAAQRRRAQGRRAAAAGAPRPEAAVAPCPARHAQALPARTVAIAAAPRRDGAAPAGEETGTTARLRLRLQRRVVPVAVAATAAALATTFELAAALAFRPVPRLVEVAGIDGVHLAAPREELVVDLRLPALGPHHVHGLVLRVQQPALHDRPHVAVRRVVYGGYLLQGISELLRERAYAAVPLLLGVALRLLHEAALLLAEVVVAHAALVAADVREAHGVGVEEDALAPTPVLHHLPRLLVVELRHDRRPEPRGHVQADLVHAPLGDLAGAQRVGLRAS